MHVNMNHKQNRGIIIYIKESMAHATEQLNVEMFQEACIIEVMLKDNDNFVVLLCVPKSNGNSAINWSKGWLILLVMVIMLTN